MNNDTNQAFSQYFLRLNKIAILIIYSTLRKTNRFTKHENDHLLRILCLNNLKLTQLIGISKDIIILTVSLIA